VSARQRRIRDRSRRFKVAQEKALRRRARGSSARPAAAVVALTMVGAGVSTTDAATTGRVETIPSSVRVTRAGEGLADSMAHRVRMAGASSVRSPECEALETPGSRTSGLTAVDGALFFTADDGTHGLELWTSDGTAAGTVLVRDFHPSERTFFSSQVAFAGRLFFAAEDRNHGRELWRSDGTKAGTVLVRNIGRDVPGESPLDLTESGGRLFFTDDRISGRELWTSDGSRTGTVKVKLIDAERDWYTYSSYLTDVGGTLFFAADDEVHGSSNQLWKSDGTTAGTRVVKDFNLSDGADIGDLTDVGGRLFFTADDGIHGRELWTSDGSRAGTVMVKEVTPGGDGYVSSLTEFEGRLFFTGYDGRRTQLWKSDGTRAGTVPVKEISNWGAALTEVGGTLFFASSDGIHGEELWKSDGTTAGTIMVKDINPNTDRVGNPLPSRPTSPTAVGETLFFTARDGVHGRELWTSDGTRAGTSLVKDITDDRRGSRAGSLTDVGGRLFFAANDGIHGRELWRSDGTAAGTVQVKDINLGAGFRVASKARANTRLGTRRVKVRVEAAGRLVVGPARGSLIKRSSADVEVAGTINVTLEPTARGMKKLKRALREAHRQGRDVGRLRVKTRFSFTSCAGGASSQTHWYTLKMN
jgi:ELWxxDGT repeat protein